ncbi:hypothetical protein CF326_g7681 [Tilletia indica]|nr:hypothetical protein CF326_g7681 [Tilletia indica]
MGARTSGREVAKALQRAVKVICLPPIEKRRPVRLNDLSAMASGCDRSRPAEIAVLAAALFAFWALCRPGEVTVRSESTPEDDRARWSDWSLRAPRTPEGVTSFLLRLPSDKTHGSALTARSQTALTSSSFAGT